jgi:hypothetical protein
MSILVRWTPPALTAEQYDEAVGTLEGQGNWPPDGLDYHVCFKANGSLHVSEIWDSQEQFDAFGERMRPVLEEVGIDPGEPAFIEIHNIIKS